ncbi:DNA polymerase I [Brevibacterium daeguense]|uniref:DNA polymerase I n=1 Tax=Brevibacterium daeguense TaxID=909936 RepID=A0ABP8ENC0_9MICO
MSTDTQRLLLIDGHSLAYRAFYALPAENFSTSTGQTTNAVYGFVSMLINVLADEEPTHIAVAFDLGRQTFRLAEYPEYKAGRAKTPDEFHGQVELIKDVLKALAIPVVVKEGFEADDVLATLACQGAAAGMEAGIVTGDKDAYQLASDSITILYPKRGVSDLTRMTPAAVEEKYGVTPANYRGIAALVGEKADNLPGVPGVGEKTAAKWLTKYGDLPNVIEAADEIGGKVGGSLREHLGEVERNYRLNQLITDLELDVSVADTRRGEVDREALDDLFDQLEFQVLGRRLEALLGSTTEERPSADIPEPRLLSAAEFTSWLQAVDAEAPVGIATDAQFALGLGTVDSIGLAQHDDVVATDLSRLDESGVDALSRLLAEHAHLTFHGAKAQLKALVQAGYPMPWLETDTEIAAYLVVPDQRAYELTDLCTRYCGFSPGQTEPEEGTLDLALGGADAALRALGRNAWSTVQLAAALRAILADAKMVGVLDEIDMPMVTILAQMELSGIAVDLTALQGLIDEFGAQAADSAEAAYAAIGHEVNLGSPKQLQAVLFDELQMPKTKRTKTGYTTDADALADLLVKTGHPFLEHLLAHRDSIKLKQTVVGLHRMVADDGRIHTSYLQTVAATGRLSSVDPNLQNIPVRTDAGRRIRDVFVPEQGAGFSELLTADYSQIEMRIMAHLSGDESLIAAFRAGEDLHSYVGARVFGVGVDEVTAEMRSKVKAMSYGLVYGLSAYGLSRQLQIGVDEARELMDGYFERFGAVKAYLDSSVENARSVGYTETMYGRRRYLPQLTSDRRQVREMAERAALNAPIQGSAADIMKIAMIRVDAALREAQLKSRVLLQVHDEIVVELAAEEYAQVAALIRSTMGGAAALSVPLDVNIGHGPTWQQAGH